MTNQSTVDDLNDPLANSIYNDGLEYAAAWLENNIRSDVPEVAEFARNMAASIRAAKKPSEFQQSFAEAIRNDAYMDAANKRYWLTMVGVQPDTPEWTTTPPTAKGWYWNCKLGETPMLTLVAHLDSQWMKKERRFWLGPLPKPEPPGVEQSIQQENTHEKLHTYQFCA